MAISTPGQKLLVFCDSGTLATTPVDPIAAGIRLASGFKRSAFKPTKDYLEGNWRNMQNFMIECETLQSTMFALKKFIEWLNVNCDAQYVSNPQTAGGAGDCYKFIGPRQAGLDFEVMWNSDKRTIKPKLEVALPYSDALAFVDGADSETPVSFPGITHPRGEDQTLLRRPFFVAFEAPKTSALFTRNEIASRSYSIKTVSKKQEETNISIVDYLLFELTVKFRDASVAEQVVMMSKDNAPSVYIKEQNDGDFYDAWDFNSGVLTLDPEFEDMDDDRAQTLKFTRKVLRWDVDFQFGPTFGGDVSDNGTKGGTMRIGY